MKRLSLALLLAAVCLQSALAQPPIFIVRHAEKAEANAANPKDPDLSATGRARAQALAETLKDAGIGAIFVTEYKRTRQTAEPTADLRAIEPVTIPAQEVTTLVAKLKETKEAALVVGHSNTVPEILKALGASDSITIAESDYDNLFIVAAGTPPRLIRLHLPAAEQKPATGKAASASAGD